VTPMARVLVACMGNGIRGDDGFGVAVARRLAGARISEDVDVAEFGIAGIGLVQHLLDGYEGLILVDAVDRGKPPGTIIELEPVVPDITGLAWDELHRVLGDMHETKPARVLLMAKSLGCLPSRVLILGCQPGRLDAGAELSAPVRAAVDPAVARIDAIVRLWTGRPAGARARGVGQR